MKLASPTELAVICLTILVILYLTLHPYEKPPVHEPLNDYLFSAWNGNLDLQWAFWPFFLILNIGLYTTDILAKTGVFTVSSWDEVHFVLLFPIAWWTVSIWRCSKNSNHQLWAALSRFITLAVLFEYALKMAIRIEYPRIFFSCEDLLLDYGNCF